jgi:C4-dicarboxylate-specific signal transduction histidine kinase
MAHTLTAEEARDGKWIFLVLAIFAYTVLIVTCNPPRAWSWRGVLFDSLIGAMCFLFLLFGYALACQRHLKAREERGQEDFIQRTDHPLMKRRSQSANAENSQPVETAEESASKKGN